MSRTADDRSSEQGPAYVEPTLTNKFDLCLLCESVRIKWNAAVHFTIAGDRS